MNAVRRERPAWAVYDESADAYVKYAAPWCFVDVARDLVAALELSPGDRVLDVGCGTGVVSAAAREAGGQVTALDMSPPMLAQVPPDIARVAGELPGLPHCDGTFDAVCASFVISHCRDLEAALADMVRVARVDGKVGVSAWAEKENVYDTVWGEVAARFVDAAAMAKAREADRPWTAWLGDTDNLRSALEGAGLGDVTIRTRDYDTDMTFEEFFENKALFLSGRFVRLHVSDAEWARFHAELDATFRRNFDGRVRFTTPAHVAVGRKRT